MTPAEAMAAAIENGYSLFAHPDTVEQLKSSELANLKVEPMELAERGVLYAIDTEFLDLARGARDQ